MSLNNFSTDLAIVTVNGRIITDFGETDPPFKTSTNQSKNHNASRFGW